MSRPRSATTALVARERTLRRRSGGAANKHRALGRNRTCGQEIRRLLLYPLSYEGVVFRVPEALCTMRLPGRIYLVRMTRHN
jgi:hypothetical protein